MLGTDITDKPNLPSVGEPHQFNLTLCSGGEQARRPLSDWHFRPHLASYLGPMFGSTGNWCIFTSKICWETWELKAACSCLKPKKHANKMLTTELFAERISYNFIHPQSKMLHDNVFCIKLATSECLWLRDWLDVSLAQHRFSLPEQISGLTSEFTWKTSRESRFRFRLLRSWPRLQALISSASCIRTTSERMPRCFCLETNVDVSFLLPIFQ